MAGGGAGGSIVTVLVAGAANLAIAVAKAVAGIISGSSSMLSEAAHSFADTVTEVLLLIALRRGARPPTARHPFGHGKAAFFWAFLAAMATLVAGAGFSITHGWHSIHHGEPGGDYLVSYLVLGIAFIIESVSLTQGLRQLRHESARLGVDPLDFVRGTSETALKAVLLEDTAALIGLVLAATGLGLTQLTGSPLWDGLASIAIGLLLAAVALLLAYANASLLMDRGAAPPLEAAIRDELAAVPGIDKVVTLRTLYLGPGSMLVAAQVDFDAARDSTGVESVADDAAARLTATFPSIRHVFLDPTGTP